MIFGKYYSHNEFYVIHSHFKNEITIYVIDRLNKQQILCAIS
jgi:hypothetical protein